MMFDIQVKLENLNEIQKLKELQEDGTAYEQNGLKYDSDGLILLNEHNGTRLITLKVAKMISLTHKNDDVIIAIEGGLNHYGFIEEERKSIIFEALKINDADKKRYKTLIEKSIERDKKQGKRGFPYLEKKYPKLKQQINAIYNIRHLFWKMHDETDYQHVEIAFIKLVDTLAGFIKKLEEEKKKESSTDEDVEIKEKRRIPGILDSYLKMMGVNGYERYKLFKKINGKFTTKDLSGFIENEIECFNEAKKEHCLWNSEINLGLANTIIHDLTYKQKSILNNLARSLDIQLSFIHYAGYYPKIQPLINLVKRPIGLQEYERRQLAHSFLRQQNNLKKTEDANYIFDDVETNSYIKVNGKKLGNYLSLKYPILQLGIEKRELDAILNISGTFDELHYEYYLFNNGVLNLHERSFTKTNNFTDYFTTKKMDCNFSIDNITIGPLNTEPACLVDRVLREIFIPNYKEGEEDIFTGYYIDFLERLGAVFNTRIKEKKFVCYYNPEGDNGKDIVIEILKMVFGDRCLLVTMDILKDEKADLSEYDVVIIDELDKNTFNDAVAFIKRITGGEEEGTAQRRLYTDEVYRPKNPSAFFLFTNEIPQVEFKEIAFYEREDAIKLKNRFIKKPNPSKKNEFKADSSLKDKIKNAKEDSLEWVVNAGLKAYYDRFDENGYFKGFTMTQTAEETMMIVSNTDPLIKFLNENYEIDLNTKNGITNSELRKNYENYCIRNNLSCDTSGLAINMGNAVKKVFGNVKKKATNATVYSLAPKPHDDMKTKIYIDSETQWWQVKEEIPEETYDNHEKVYDRIVELEGSSVNPTIEQLIEEFPSFDVNGIIKNLISADLIFKGGKLEN
ncbi:hypothetical protein [Methanobrevibacter sp.]|uniref:hypothetical protein n=1 Tax=Methanobrevibacter sp. TaxID=66852 RepID=UPI00386D3BFB